jgi:hypothetical protein
MFILSVVGDRCVERNKTNTPPDSFRGFRYSGLVIGNKAELVRSRELEIVTSHVASLERGIARQLFHELRAKPSAFFRFRGNDEPLPAHIRNFSGV